jgi:hypothetical protein
MFINRKFILGVLMLSGSAAIQARSDDAWVTFPLRKRAAHEEPLPLRLGNQSREVGVGQEWGRRVRWPGLGIGWAE